MADPVYLSIWLRGFTAHNMLRHFEKALCQVPFSRLSPGAWLRVYALEIQEPPLFERRFEQDAEPAEIAQAAAEFRNEDCAYQLECFWDLWQRDRDWALRPAPLTLTCLAPLFPAELGEQIVVEFGPDHLYLPEPDALTAGTPIRSNIRSLLRLVEELCSALPVSSRSLWCESGKNLAERLAHWADRPG